MYRYRLQPVKQNVTSMQVLKMAPTKSAVFLMNAVANRVHQNREGFC